MVQIIDHTNEYNKQKKRKYSSLDETGVLDILPIELLEEVMKMLTFKDLMASFFTANHDTAIKVIHFLKFYPLLSFNAVQVDSRLLQYVRPINGVINDDEDFRVESGGSECSIFYFYHFFGDIERVDLSQWQERVTDFGLEQLVSLAMEKMRLKKKPITQLDISNSSLLTVRSAKHLRMLMGLGLKKLVANNCSLIGQILSTISSDPNFPQLVDIDLSDNPQLSWTQLHKFLSLTPNLKRLNISSCLSASSAQNSDNASLVVEFSTDFLALQCSKSIRSLNIFNTPLSLGIDKLFQNEETSSTSSLNIVTNFDKAQN